MANFYVRNPRFACVARSEAYFFIEQGRVVCQIEPVDVESLSLLLREISLPASQETVDALLDAETLQLLLENRVLLSGSEEELSRLLPQQREATLPCKRLVFGVTGAVASLHVPSLLFGLYHSFAEKIDVIFTESAHHFVQPEVLSFLDITPWSHPFTPRGEIRVPHIHLATSAELIVVFPASAHTLHKLAHGACSDLLSLTISATKAPVVLIPAMNEAMWTNPAVERNVRQLRQDGSYVVEPALGVEVAKGRQSYRDYGNAGVAGSIEALLGAILARHKAL